MPQIGKNMNEQPMQYIKNKKVLADYWLKPFCLSSIFDVSKDCMHTLYKSSLHKANFRNFRKHNALGSQGDSTWLQFIVYAAFYTWLMYQRFWLLQKPGAFIKKWALYKCRS